MRIITLGFGVCSGERYYLLNGIIRWLNKRPGPPGAILVFLCAGFILRQTSYVVTTEGDRERGRDEDGEKVNDTFSLSYPCLSWTSQLNKLVTANFQWNLFEQNIHSFHQGEKKKNLQNSKQSICCSFPGAAALISGGFAEVKWYPNPHGQHDGTRGPVDLRVSCRNRTSTVLNPLLLKELCLLRQFTAPCWGLNSLISKWLSQREELKDLS